MLTIMKPSSDKVQCISNHCDVIKKLATCILKFHKRKKKHLQMNITVYYMHFYEWTDTEYQQILIFIAVGHMIL